MNLTNSIDYTIATVSGP